MLEDTPHWSQYGMAYGEGDVFTHLGQSPRRRVVPNRAANPQFRVDSGRRVVGGIEPELRAGNEVTPEDLGLNFPELRNGQVRLYHMLCKWQPWLNELAAGVTRSIRVFCFPQGGWLIFQPLVRGGGSNTSSEPLLPFLLKAGYLFMQICRPGPTQRGRTPLRRVRPCRGFPVWEGEGIGVGESSPEYSPPIPLLPSSSDVLYSLSFTLFAHVCGFCLCCCFHVRLFLFDKHRIIFFSTPNLPPQPPFPSVFRIRPFPSVPSRRPHQPPVAPRGAPQQLTDHLRAAGGQPPPPRFCNLTRKHHPQAAFRYY